MHGSGRCSSALPVVLFICLLAECERARHEKPRKEIGMPALPDHLSLARIDKKNDDNDDDDCECMEFEATREQQW